jgi:hypothetical protein
VTAITHCANVIAFEICVRERDAPFVQVKAIARSPIRQQIVSVTSVTDCGRKYRDLNLFDGLLPTLVQ